MREPSKKPIFNTEVFNTTSRLSGETSTQPQPCRHLGVTDSKVMPTYYHAQKLKCWQRRIYQKQLTL